MDALTIGDAGTKFKANDETTKNILDAAVNAGTLTETSGEYSFAAAGTVNFGGAELNLTISTAVADSVDIHTQSNIVIKNGDNANDLTISGATASTNLNTIKNDSTLSSANANSYMAVVDQALTELNTNRSAFGSTQNQVESAVRNLMTQATNVKAAESIIRDVDYAAESANFNKQNIISQAGSYAISQANAVQQNVLRLLQ